MRFLACSVCLFGFALAVAAADELTLSSDGKSDYVIVLPAKPSAVERTAAQELQQYLAEMSGATLPVVAETEVPEAARRLVVGDSSLTRKLLPGFDPTQLAPDAIVIKSVGHDLVLVGHPRRGTLYAVYTLLEDVLGVRWWTQTETRIPKRPTVSLPAMDVAYAPVVEDRATRYLELSDGCFTNHSLVTEDEQRRMGIFSARLKLNGHDHYCIPEEYGGRNLLLGWVHTFSEIEPLLPPSQYFKEHPEWYALVDGERKSHGTQLCLTNDQMRRELTRRALERLRENPGATMISISQNDNNNHCECPKCLAVEQREESPAGLLIEFVNAVAVDIEKEFPGVLVETLAYRYTRRPPKTARPRHNVIVRLCTIECDFSEPLASGEDNKAFRDDIEAWGRISPQLYIWNYVTNFRNYLIPHPNWHVLAPNLRYFIDHKAIGIFEQGDSGCRVGDFVRLRAWLLAHLLWKPEADEKKLVDEFLDGYYGAAGPYLGEYLELISEAGQRKDIDLRCYMTDTRSWLTLEDLNRAMRLFDRALEAVADDPGLSDRVRRERLLLDHVWLRQYESLRREARRKGVEFLGPEDPGEALQEFRELLVRHRAGEYRQGRRVPEDFGSDFAVFARKRIPPGDTPESCKGLAKEDWIDLQEADYIPRSRPDLFSIEKDEAASNGLTRRMPNTHTIWACHSYPLGDYGVSEGSRWQVCMRLRCDATTDQGPAMTIGIYDDANRRGVVTRRVAVEKIRGKQYKLIELGAHALGAQMYVWAAPVVREPGEVEAVYVDRVFLKRCP